LASAPISNLPKQHLKAPPLDPANPSPAHHFLPIPSSSAKLKSVSASPPNSIHNSPQGYTRFPPLNHNLSESELDPYFIGYEASTRTYENLLTGSIERVNRRILKRLSELSIDYSELGARYNAFSLSESGDLASAIEKIGQAVDSSYIATEELARILGSGFAEPLRESAQFAGVVQKVLRYRVLKRVQEEMTRDLLQQKRSLLQSLERSEMEARRIEQYLHGTSQSSGFGSSSTTTSGTADFESRADHDDVESIDSGDFPPTHSDTTPPPQRSKSISQRPGPSTRGGGQDSQKHRKSQSYSAPPSSGVSGGGGFLAKGFGKLNYAIHGIVDVDPERTRRDNIGKTREQLQQLEAAIEVAEKDVKDASRGILKDLRRFQKGKEEDLKKMMVCCKSICQSV
jgi:sorting nexin-41/42